MPPVEIQIVTVCILFNEMTVSVCTHIYISKFYDNAGKISCLYDELVGCEPLVIHAVDNPLFSWDAKADTLQMFFFQ